MFKKVKAYFEGKNPYLMASAAIVIVSVVIISLLLKAEMTKRQETDTASVSTQQSQTESVEEVVNPGESGEQSVSEVFKEEVTEIASKEESESVIPEVLSVPAETPVPEVVPIPEITLTPEPTPTPEVTPIPEPEPTPEVIPIPEPEPTPKVTPTPELTTSSEITPTPEPIPSPEITPTPEPTPSPEITPAPEPEPTPEVTPTPHEHSWIFQSWYQEPTCSNGGLVIEICGNCGETQVTGGTPTGKHSYTVESPGDCCSQEVVVCTECNYREIREKDPGNHIDVEDGFCYGCGKKTD